MDDSDFSSNDQDEEKLRQARVAAWNKLGGNQEISIDQGSAIKADVVPESPGLLEGAGNIGRAIQLKGLRDDQAAHDASRQYSGDLPSDYQSPAQLAQKQDIQNMAMGSISSGSGGRAFNAAREKSVNEMQKPIQWTTEKLQALAEKAKEITASPTMSPQDKAMTFQKLRTVFNNAKVRGVKLPEGE